MDIYLHHYPASLFSEKVRVLLGYLGLPWRSVVTSSIMPRPLLMPLTGGYRKTPNLQIGANVFSDTAVIGRGLARHAGDETLFAAGFNGDRVAEWADSQLFRVTVALNFRPEAVAQMMSQLSEAEVNAFMEDRAALSGGSAITTFSPGAALGYLTHYLAGLEANQQQAFLFGDTPSMADFAVYHCLWFVEANPVNAPLLEPYPRTRAWMERMAGFGHGTVQEATGEEALAHARACEPVDPELRPEPPDGFAIGDSVTVTPVDYGRIPVAGRLVTWTANEVVVARESPETGPVFNHFPSAGFEVAQQS